MNFEKNEKKKKNEEQKYYTNKKIRTIDPPGLVALVL